ESLVAPFPPPRSPETNKSLNPLKIQREGSTWQLGPTGKEFAFVSSEWCWNPGHHSGGRDYGAQSQPHTLFRREEGCRSRLSGLTDRPGVVSERPGDLLRHSRTYPGPEYR